MIRILLAAALLALAACGVDGEPQPPAGPAAAPASGVSVSGDARLGVVGRL